MVEADATVLGSVTMALGIAGLTVDAARSRGEALALTKRYRYGLVLANLRMPGLDGPTLYRELAHRWPEGPLRIIFISNSLFSPDYAQFLLEIGAPVLVKPVAPCALWNRVEEQLVS